MFAQVAFVQLQRGLVVEAVQHIAFATGNQTFGAKAVPAALRAMANLQRIAIQANRQQGAAADLLVAIHKGLPKTFAIAG